MKRTREEENMENDKMEGPLPILNEHFTDIAERYTRALQTFLIFAHRPRGVDSSTVEGVELGADFRKFQDGIIKYRQRIKVQNIARISRYGKILRIGTT
jgi:hypothetical protein